MILKVNLGGDPLKDPRIVISERNGLVEAAAKLSPNNSMEDIEKEKSLIIQIKKNTNPTPFTVNLTKYADYIVHDFMKEICSAEFEANKQIRMIYQGRLLKDDDNIKDIKFKPETVMHIFISDPVQKDMNITTISADLFEPERKGFDKFRPLDLM